MKEIIEDALVKFGLNRIISKEEKEEAMKTFSIPKEQNILFISENKDCTLIITDFAIYFQINNTNENVTDLATSILTIGGTLVGIGLGLGKKAVKTIGNTLLKKKLPPILWNKIVSIEEEKITKDDKQFSILIFKIEGEKENIKILFSSSIFYELFYYIHTESKNNSQAIPVIEKIRQLLAQNNIQEAQMFLKSVKINEKSPYYKEYLSLSAEIYKKNNNFYKAAQAYDDLRSLDKGNLESFSQYGREKQNNYNNYLTHFKELPLRERNIITISNTDKLFKSNHITLLNIEQLPAINFPMSHPKVNQTYIAHPYKADTYLPIESYDYELLNDRMDEFFYILQCLGATSITIETIKKENNEGEKNLNIGTNIGGSKEGIGVELDAKYSKAASTSLSKYMGLERAQTFNPDKRPYIPKNTIWFHREPRWQRLAQQRLEGGILTYTERISSSENQRLNKEEIIDINAELKTLLYSVKAGVQYEKEEKLQQNEEFSFSINIEFKPIKEFLGETDIIDIIAEEIIQTPVQLPTTNDNEARYLEEIHIMLEDDGVIDERERMILERIRERYNITPERARELEAQAIAGQELTSEEQEYLSEYKNSLQDGAISEKERRLLNRLAMALGISEERIIEIEKLV
ncbi:tellurite resistance TerB family protein [Capnocytophaga gingivalis]|mgnify:CR=1 FL=1|uniref:tellurite resistance TerB family protein n=1 Tax=Capnocytophaga gingivalis TaxID=1017 RepID=UPI002B4801EB|nr:hypothetical protein [Capnocytophaga gingivalis]MEB3013293.1 hypothetical protein [Capnocytophaga gingivalis]